MRCIHATCVRIAGTGVLLCGPPGAGKSDLALRLIDGGALLVADDQVSLERAGDRLLAGCPTALAGLLEVRGLGILPVPSVADMDGEGVPVGLVVRLVEAVDRLPEPQHHNLLGLALPALDLRPFEASAAARVRLAVTALQAGWPLVPARFDHQSATVEPAR
jgi:HPr kinase/phosphorylase